MNLIEEAVDQPKKSVTVPDAAAPRHLAHEKMDEFFNQLQADMRRPDLSQEAVAAAFQEIQRIALESDVEESASRVVTPAPGVCRVCGAHNPAEHKFCAACGVPLEGMQPRSAEPGGEKLPEGPHHYHHHYHHHYFSSGAGPVAHSDLRPPIAAVAAKDTPKSRSPLAATGPSRAETAVRKLLLDWMQACNTKHLDDLVDLYTPDALVLRPNLAPVRGTAAIREFFFTALDSGLGEVEFEPLRTELLGEVAFEAGRCKMLVPVSMGKRREERGKYLVVLIRQPGGEWKMSADSWSSDLSLAPPAESTQAKPARKV
jgi:ketosteroid isomerase-like protein